jgi:tetratricopeptide (TPR) repeat protein
MRAALAKRRPDLVLPKAAWRKPWVIHWSMSADPAREHAILHELIGTQEAVIEGERSLALNPSFIEAYAALCAANNFLGRPDRALELADKAIRLSPRDPSLRFLYHMKGWALFMKQQDDQAIEWLRRAEGGTVFTELILASALALTGRQAEARETLKRYSTMTGVTTTTIVQLRKQQLSLADNPTWVAYNERLFEGLRKAGMPEE